MSELIGFAAALAAGALVASALFLAGAALAGARLSEGHVVLVGVTPLAFIALVVLVGAAVARGELSR